MSSLILPSRWNKQPQYPVGVDWNHPLTKGIAGVYNALFAKNLANPGNAGDYQIVDGGGFTPVYTSKGIARAVPRSHFYAVRRPGSAIESLFLLYQPTTIATNSSIFGITDGNYGPALGSTSSKFRFNVSSNSGAYIEASNTITDGQVYSVFGTAWGSANTQRSMYVDGVDVGINSTGSGLTNQTAQAIILNEYTNFTNGAAAGNIILGIGWKAGPRMGQAEARALYENPWQIFKPIQRKLYFLPSSGGTALNGTVGSATASGYNATVNAQRNIAASLGSASATGLAASVSTATVIQAALGTATASGLAANVNASRSIAASAGTASASGLHSNINAQRNLSASVGTAVASGYLGNLNAQRNISAALGLANASGISALVSTGFVISGNVGSAAASGFQASLSNNTNISCALGTASAQGYHAQVLTNVWSEAEVTAMAEALLTRAPWAAKLKQLLNTL